ncbi:sugar phosphate isomerase/epimerase family protein [Terriglobus roseus]|nr:sugar phosphate isomerase/epimerase family protein [Terriglobus roseus]
MPRREFLRKASLFAVSFVPQTQLISRFKVGLVPFGKTTVETGVQDFWNHAHEVAALGVHDIEFNNTRAQIAEAYLRRLPELREGMSALGIRMPGLAQYSHMDKQSELEAIRQQHLLLGEFMSKIGGHYITHMIAPSSILNEVADEAAYSQIDLKTWIKNLNEVARNVFEQWGVKLAYHPEQREVNHHLYEQVLQSTDERFVHFVADVGHLAAGGEDAVEACKKYRKRLVAVHLKDFSPTPPNGSVLKAGDVAFGKGNVDLAGIVAELKRSRFTGWVMGESGAGDEAMYRYMTENLRLTF